MSLRARVILSMAVVLLASIWLGALFAGYQARLSLQDELVSGLTGARQTVRSAFEDLPRSDHPARDLRQLIGAFDGDRHVRAVLVDTGGRVVLSSTTAERMSAAPGWFKAWLGAAPPALDIPVPGAAGGYRAVELRPTADLDVAATWREFSGVVLILTSAIIVGLIAVALVIRATLRPLAALSAEFVHVGAGDYHSRVAADGPDELRGLQEGFNAMVERLAIMAERNRLLGDQLLTLQEEERAEVARDLHDEIGAHLFAVNMDAKMIAKAGEHDPALVELAGSVQTAVGHMQRHVRDLLMRLRPLHVIELGLEMALSDLVSRWSARRPEIAFKLRMDAGEQDKRIEPDSDKLSEVIYRVAQEALANAVRHSQASAIEVEVRALEDEIVLTIADNGRSCASVPGAGGFGLIGMRERVASCGGRLTFGPRPGDAGWSVSARLPNDRSAAKAAPALEEALA